MKMDQSGGPGVGPPVHISQHPPLAWRVNFLLPQKNEDYVPLTELDHQADGKCSGPPQSRANWHSAKSKADHLEAELVS